MAELLHLKRIESIPKKVYNAVKFGAASCSIEEKAKLFDITNRIKSGRSLEEFYRRDIDSEDDEMLARFGIMHLHLKGKGSNELLFLMQFDKCVFFLEVGYHRAFNSDPLGNSLAYKHRDTVSQAEEKEKEAAEKLAKIKTSLSKKKPTIESWYPSIRKLLDWIK